MGKLRQHLLHHPKSFFVLLIALGECLSLSSYGFRLTPSPFQILFSEYEDGNLALENVVEACMASQISWYLSADSCPPAVPQTFIALGGVTTGPATENWAEKEIEEHFRFPRAALL